MLVSSTLDTPSYAYRSPPVFEIYYSGLADIYGRRVRLGIHTEKNRSFRPLIPQDNIVSDADDSGYLYLSGHGSFCTELR